MVLIQLMHREQESLRLGKVQGTAPVLTSMGAALKVKGKVFSRRAGPIIERSGPKNMPIYSSTDDTHYSVLLMNLCCWLTIQYCSCWHKIISIVYSWNTGLCYLILFLMFSQKVSFSSQVFSNSKEKTQLSNPTATNSLNTVLHARLLIVILTYLIPPSNHQEIFLSSMAHLHYETVFHYVSYWCEHWVVMSQL